MKQSQGNHYIKYTLREHSIVSYRFPVNAIKMIRIWLADALSVYTPEDEDKPSHSAMLIRILVLFLLRITITADVITDTQIGKTLMKIKRLNSSGIY